MSAEFADVSVIMPAYRAGATIGRALASIAAQTLKPREVVIVDDGSPDDTVAAARRMEDRMEGINLLILTQPNAGPGAARNKALRHARSEWVAFLDADDEWLPAKIERSFAHLAGGAYDLVAHDGWEIENGVSTPLDCSTRYPQRGDPFVELYRRGFIDTCSVVCRRDQVFAVGGFDESLPVGQDFDLFLALLAPRERSFLVFPERLVRYHITPGSVTSNRWRRLTCQMRIVRRHRAALNGRSRFAPGDVWFRALAVHYEAAMAFRRRGDSLNAVLACLRVPLGLLAAFGRADPRQAPLRPDEHIGHRQDDQKIFET
jgi:teichuronic acid biosynthesis glycosyltransferase TuaG